MFNMGEGFVAVFIIRVVFIRYLTELSVLRLYGGAWWKGLASNRSWTNWGTIPVIAGGNCGKPRKTAVTIASAPVKIRASGIQVRSVTSRPTCSVVQSKIWYLRNFWIYLPFLTSAASSFLISNLKGMSFRMASTERARSVTSCFIITGHRCITTIQKHWFGCRWTKEFLYQDKGYRTQQDYEWQSI